jgi:hypothetical protein
MFVDTPALMNTDITMKPFIFLKDFESLNVFLPDICKNPLTQSLNYS